MRVALATAFGSLAVLVGCATNPVTGSRGVVLVSSESERRLGAEEAATVEATVGIVENVPLTTYVRAIGMRLVAQAPGAGDFAFHVVDMDEPNAFALPGGYVYVSRGLVALANHENELAGVIGHEIGHVLGRHAAKRVSVTAPLGLATGVAAAAAGMVAPRVGGLLAGVGGATTQLLTNPYSRSQEREADETGQRLVAAAGWDPAGLARLLETLGREEQLTQGRVRRTAFFSSHPSTPSRVADATARARTLTRGPATPIAPDRAALLRRLDGLVIGPNPENGVVRETRLLHPGFDFTLLFPATWTIENQPIAVVGTGPSRRTAIVLELEGEGADPMAAARAFLAAHRLDGSDGPRAAHAGTLPAARATATVRDGRQRGHVELAWIAHEGRIFRLSGICDPSDASALAEPFADTLASSRSLTLVERRSIDVVRLRVESARAGESLAALARRTGSVWTLDAIAVANALAPDARLAAGALVKVARREVYRRGR